jgi:hydrogenase nickel incorporation protein HypA/HybF
MATVSGMHELSLAQNIMEIVERAVPPEQNARASTIRLRVGEFAAVVEDSLSFCFEAITRGTRLEGSRLSIERVPGMELQIIEVELPENDEERT